MDPVRGMIHLGLKLTETTLGRTLDVVRLVDTLLVASAVPAESDTTPGARVWPEEEQGDLDALSATLRARQEPTDTPTPTPTPRKKSTARRSTPGKSAAKRTAGTGSTAPKTAAQKTAAKKTAAKKTTAQKTAAKKSAPTSTDAPSLVVRPDA